MTNEQLDKLGPVVWVTMHSHPFSGIKYQEAETEFGTVARVTQAGYEVITPDLNTDHVHKQFSGRVSRYLNPK